MYMSNNQQNALATIISGGLRSIAASVPILASIGQAWSEYKDYQTGERISELMENLKTKLEELSTRINNLDEIYNQIREEFPSLLEIAIDKVQKEFSQEKRRIYADVLANLSFQQYQEPYEDKISVLHSLDALNPNDLDVLKLFRRKEESVAKELDWRSLDLHGDDNQKLAELASMLAKLESRGLIITIRLHNGVVYVPDGLDQSIARLGETKYRILPLGNRILSALE
jgi:predicted nuclease with TOPRIM domain